MKNDNGFVLIGVIAALMVISIVAAAGYLFVQERRQDGAENDQNQNTSQQQSHDNHEHQADEVEEEWVEYHYDPYGLTFEHPVDWHVETEMWEDSEEQPNILVKNEEGQLVLGYYRQLSGNEECDEPAHDVEPQPGLNVGQNQATVMKTCDDAEQWIGTQTNNEYSLAITTSFLGQPYEADARKLLESTTGLSLPIIN